MAPTTRKSPLSPGHRKSLTRSRPRPRPAARRAGEPALAVRTRQRYGLVQSLEAQGKGIKPVKRETGLANGTARRFHYAETADELLVKVKDGRPSILDGHKP